MAAEAGGLADAAIRALGPLFRLTEVFLWDDASKPSTCRGAPPEEDSAGYASSAISCSHVDSIMDDAVSVEDLDLAKQMDALGLPTSFTTNKERRNTPTGGKRREVLTKSTFTHNVRGGQVPDISRLDEVMDRTSSQASEGSRTLSCTGLAKQATNGTSCFNSESTFSKAVPHSDSEPNDQDVVILEKINKEQLCTSISNMVITDGIICKCDPLRINVEPDADSGITLVDCSLANIQENAVDSVSHICYQDEKLCEQGRHKKLEDASSLCCVTEAEEISIDSKPVNCFPDGYRFGNKRHWGVFWDSFYMRNYYYNFHTHESTWSPPSGLEHSGLLFTSCEINGDVAEEGTCLFAWNENNHEGALKVTTPSKEVQNDGEVPEHVVEENSYLTVAWGDNNHQGALKASNISQRIQNDELPGQASHEVMSRDNYVTENLISDMDPSLVSARYMNLDEQVEQTSYSETSISAEDFCAFPFSPSDTMDHVDRCKLANASNDAGADENSLCVSQQLDMVSMPTDLLSHHHVMDQNRKRKVRRIKCNQKISSGVNEDHILTGTMEGLPPYLAKYWCQRYLLFSKFDDGVKVDEEGWFSVTPEALSRHHASRCGHGTVIDCFTGVGGNAIQFAMKSNHVIAIDVDTQKVDYAQHNATIYGVGSNIDFIKGDFFVVASCLKADTIFMSPPWGGPNYARVQIYDIRSMLKPCDGFFLFKTAMRIAPTVVMFLPRNVDPNQLAELSLLAHPPWELEVERNYLNGKLKGITAYFRQPSNKSQEVSSDLDLLQACQKS